MHPNRVLADDGVGPVGCTLTAGVRLLAAPTNGVANALATWAAIGWPRCGIATCLNGLGFTFSWWALLLHSKKCARPSSYSSGVRLWLHPVSVAWDGSATRFGSRCACLLAFLCALDAAPIRWCFLFFRKMAGEFSLVALGFPFIK